MEGLTRPVYIEATNRVFFSFFARQPEWVQRMLCDESFRAYSDRMLYDSLARNRARTNTLGGIAAQERSVIDYFIVDSSIALYRHWHLSGRQVPLERMIEITGGLLEHGLSSLRT